MSEKSLKLYEVIVDGTTYYGTGVNAYAAYANVVAYDDKEGNFSHKDELDLTVKAVEIDPTTTEFIAWGLSNV